MPDVQPLTPLRGGGDADGGRKPAVPGMLAPGMQAISGRHASHGAGHEMASGQRELRARERVRGTAGSAH